MMQSQIVNTPSCYEATAKCILVFSLWYKIFFYNCLFKNLTISFLNSSVPQTGPITGPQTVAATLTTLGARVTVASCSCLGPSVDAKPISHITTMKQELAMS